MTDAIPIAEVLGWLNDGILSDNLRSIDDHTKSTGRAVDWVEARLEHVCKHLGAIDQDPVRNAAHDLLEALNRIASWGEGDEVNSRFDEPVSASIARDAIAKIKRKDAPTEDAEHDAAQDTLHGRPL